VATPRWALATLLTDARPDGREHAVDEDEIAALSVGHRPRALCGAVIEPAALAAPAGRPCADCVERLAFPGQHAARPVP
jgi:hypothetical protein